MYVICVLLFEKDQNVCGLYLLKRLISNEQVLQVIYWSYCQYMYWLHNT